MILSPLQDGAMFGKADWIRTAPRINQYFGGNYVTYVRFGMKGHNGIDFGCPIGTPIFAPFDGEVTALETTDGYGIHAKIRSRDKLLECVLGHLSQIKQQKDMSKWVMLLAIREIPDSPLDRTSILEFEDFSTKKNRTLRTAYRRLWEWLLWIF